MVFMKLLPDQSSICGGWFGLPPRPRTQDFDRWGGAGALGAGVLIGSCLRLFRLLFRTAVAGRPRAVGASQSLSVRLKPLRAYHLPFIGALIAQNGAHFTSCTSS